MKDNCPWHVQLPITQPPRYITYPGVMPNTYVITDFGQIFNVVKGYEVSQFINNGYYICNLNRPDGSQYLCSVHRLVAWEWVLENRDFNLHINHIDGNKLNNNYWNLEWVTPAENARHAWRTGLIPANINQGETHGMAKLTDADVHLICQMLQDPKVTYDEVLDRIGHKVARGDVMNIANGRGWTHITRLYKIPPRETMLGETHPMSKLTNEDVHRICYMLQDPKVTYDQIAEMFKDKCKIGTIIDIAHGNTWTHISRHYRIPHRERVNSSGVNSSSSKLTEEEVHEICQMLLNPSNTYKQIAECFGDKISTHGVHKIAKGDSYVSIRSQYKIPPRENDRVKIARISSKLDEEKVHQICQMLQDPRIMYKDIGAKFGVCDHTILDIAHGNNWKDVSSQYEIPDRSSKNHAVSKLNPSQVYQICEMLQDPYVMYKDIGEKFGVSIGCIQGIASGCNWPEITSQFNIPKRIRLRRRKPNY